MILHAATQDSVVCVSQAAHAWISGQMARAWGNAAFARHEPWESVCLACEQHDVGMAEWDLRPRLDPDTGRPLSFLKMPEDIHIALWRAAPDKVLATSPHAALLVSMHGTSLMRHREPTRQVQSYIAEQEALQERLIELLGANRDHVQTNRETLWCMDHLSLALMVDGWSPADVVAPGRREMTAELVQGNTLIVDPWPFATDQVHVGCYGRRLDGRFTDEAEMHAALDAAPWEKLQYVLVPG